MKEGDILICKNSRYKFNSGSIYEIIIIEEINVFGIVWVLIGPKNSKSGETDWLTHDEIYEFFYTPKELRKIKLDKIKDGSRSR